MKRGLVPAIAAAFLLASWHPAAQQPNTTPARVTAGAPAPAPYFPERMGWQHKRPEEAGLNAALVAESVRVAVAAESQANRDLATNLAITFGRNEPFDSVIGPVKPRGPASGLVVKNGYIVAEWGEPGRVDMTFSVTKTFLTTVVGLAWQRGLIRDVNDPVRDYMPPDVDLFTSEHNRKITWDHLLRQTSDWQGTLWGKPDWADRPEGERAADWPNRPLREPGTHFKYNDVRVNALALAALHVIRRPLPEVLREEIMEPIGASSTWRWHGYENSWVELDGQRMQSVSGGGHWGGGMFIDAFDMARFGYLFLRNGRWKDRTIVSEKWMQMARTPGPANPTYGFANWYLNTDRKPLPAAPASAVYFVGNGNNFIYIDWENDLVVVARWVDTTRSLNEIVGKLIAASKPGQTTAGR
jgi:CubicO group peptidase (beta-lactamase class C family)